MPPNQTSANVTTDMTEHSQVNISVSHERPRIHITRAQVEYWTQYRNSRNKYLYRQVKNLFEYVIVVESSLLTSLIYCLIRGVKTESQNIVGGFIMLTWSAFYIMRAVRLLVNLRVNTLEYAKKKHIITTAIKDFLLTAAHLQAALLFFKEYCSNIYSIAFPMAFALLLPLLAYNKSTNSCFTFIRATKIVVGVFRLTIILILVLQYSKKINNGSPLIYLPVWLYLFIVLLGLLFTITVTIFSICAIVKEKKFKKEGIHFILVIGGVYVISILMFQLILIGYTLITVISDDYLLLQPKEMVIILSVGNAMSVAVIVYFAIIKLKIPAFFESLLFYDELVIEAEIDKAAIEYSKPIELVVTKFDGKNQMHAVKTGPSIFKLHKGTCSIINHYKPPSYPQHKTIGLFNSKIKSSTYISAFGIKKKPNAKEINEIINKRSVKEPNNSQQSTMLDCIICLDKKVESFFLPCGHSGSCYNCAIALLKATGICHLCRQVIA